MTGRNAGATGGTPYGVAGGVPTKPLCFSAQIGEQLSTFVDEHRHLLASCLDGLTEAEVQTEARALKDHAAGSGEARHLRARSECHSKRP